MDNTFWAFIGLVLFLLVVAYFKVPGMIAKALDARSVKIKADIEEARALKEEAKQQLAEYQRRRHDAEIEAREIVAGAQREAEGLLAEARIKSEQYIARRSAMAETKIAQAENDAITEVRRSAVDIAVAAATRILAERSTGAESARFIEEAIGDVRKRLN